MTISLIDAPSRALGAERPAPLPGALWWPANCELCPVWAVGAPSAALCSDCCALYLAGGLAGLLQSMPSGPDLAGPPVSFAEGRAACWALMSCGPLNTTENRGGNDADFSWQATFSWNS